MPEFRGNPHALEPQFLVGLIQQKVAAFLKPRKRTGDPVVSVEDLVQEAAAAVLRVIHRFDPSKASIQTFVSCVTERVLIDDARKRSAAKRSINRCEHVERELGEVSLDHVPDATTSELDEQRHDLAMDLADAIAQLPPEQRQTVLACLTNSVPNVARDAGVHHQTIYRQLRAIRARWERGTLGDYRKDP